MSKHGLLISDFNIENLAAYLRNDSADPGVTCTVAPYGQVTQSLLGDSQTVGDGQADFAVVWTLPESVLESFRLVLSGQKVEAGQIAREVDEYAQKLLHAKTGARVVFVPTWVVPTCHFGQGMLDLAAGLGVSRALLQANLRLLENLDQASHLIPLNASQWIELAGPKAFNPRLWYAGKIPFGNEVFKTAAHAIKAGLRGCFGRSRKLIILDLDDTLWGGIVGDVGWQKIALGGHHALGEAFVDFQRELKALSRRGVVLAIASKNDEAVALEAIRSHPEMILRTEDFAGWRINWNDKAQNIAELVAALNLGLDSVVFIDDNPVERARVRDMLPDVFVPEWPADPRLYPQALSGLDCFDKPAVSVEDQQRSAMYAAENRRTELKSQIGSLDEWLAGLELKVKVELLDAANLSRATQLLNKTNQMNLSTRRLTDEEFLNWARAAGHWAAAFNVSDKFGDYGLTGILSLEIDGHRAVIRDFLLSCRVMGRRVEETMLHVAVGWARSAGLQRVAAAYSPTPKNKPCLEFFVRSGFQRSGENEFVWETDRDYPPSACVHLTVDPKDDQ